VNKGAESGASRERRSGPTKNCDDDSERRPRHAKPFRCKRRVADRSPWVGFKGASLDQSLSDADQIGSSKPETVTPKGRRSRSSSRITSGSWGLDGCPQPPCRPGAWAYGAMRKPSPDPPRVPVRSFCQGHSARRAWAIALPARRPPRTDGIKCVGRRSLWAGCWHLLSWRETPSG
jgi:hypothetical protein